jgi:hypothetical protein
MSILQPTWFSQQNAAKTKITMSKLTISAIKKHNLFAIGMLSFK